MIHMFRRVIYFLAAGVKGLKILYFCVTYILSTQAMMCDGMVELDYHQTSNKSQP